jgi:F-type H+-transporting ATPase subunit a
MNSLGHRVAYRISLLSIMAMPLIGYGADGGHHGVSPKAIRLIDGLPITNSMVTSWVVSLLIIILIRLAVAKPSLVPSKGQMLVESIADAVRGISGPIVGKKLAHPTFWLMSGLFIFILVQNWCGLLPGVGSIGWGHSVGDSERFLVLKPLIRPGNADLNMTAALAIVSIGAWLYYILRYAGPIVIFKDLFGNKADPKETPKPLYLLLFVIFGFVGIIEVISICVRPVSLSFRLFGNVFGGENLLHSMFGLAESIPGLSFILPVPFYFLETLIGGVQALVFMLLISVYIGLICNHEGDGDH